MKQRSTFSEQVVRLKLQNTRDIKNSSQHCTKHEFVNISASAKTQGIVNFFNKTGKAHPSIYVDDFAETKFLVDWLQMVRER